VVALPRGGVVVAAEVAHVLDAPLDILVVRKLGCPWQPELGMGAIAEGDITVLNEGVIELTGMDDDVIDAVIRRERRELRRRVERYRGDRAALSVEGRTVILVDDGIATGFTVRAAVEVLRRRGAAQVILAVPVAPFEAIESLRHVADEVVTVLTPVSLMAIGEFYEEFSQTSDEEVVALLGTQEEVPPAQGASGRG